MLDGAGVEPEEGSVGDDVDEARAAHDEAAVKTVHGQAIRAAEALGVAMTQKERATALGLFPKVSKIYTPFDLDFADSSSGGWLG